MSVSSVGCAVCRLLSAACRLPSSLQRTGLDQALVAASDPNYTGPQLPAQQFVLDLPWWFFGAQPTTAAAAPPPISEQPPASRPEGVPAAGPYTVSGGVGKARSAQPSAGCNAVLLHQKKCAAGSRMVVVLVWAVLRAVFAPASHSRQTTANQ